MRLNHYLTKLANLADVPNVAGMLTAIGDYARMQEALAQANRVKYVPRRKKSFKIARPKLGEETTSNYIMSDPKVEDPQFNLLNVGGGNEITPVDIDVPDIPDMLAAPVVKGKASKTSPAALDQPKRDPLFDASTPMPSNIKLPEFKSTLDVLPEFSNERKAQPLTRVNANASANAWRANAAAELSKAAPGVAGMHTGVRGGMSPSAPTPADTSVKSPVSATTSAPAPADTPVESPVPAAASVKSQVSSTTPAPAPAAASVKSPVSAAAKPSKRSIKDITAADMRRYRKYTAAGNMNSEMDRWKTLQAMQGNRNASNRDYRRAKRRGEVK